MMWYSEIESKIFTLVEYEMKKKYPDLNCTTVSKDDNPAQFPTLYLHEIQPVEVGNDLDNADVNAIMETIEIQVWTNSNEYTCRNIISDAISVMKTMRFNITMLPNVQTVNNTQYAIARFRRVIGSEDELY